MAVFLNALPLPQPNSFSCWVLVFQVRVIMNQFEYSRAAMTQSFVTCQLPDSKISRGEPAARKGAYEKMASIGRVNYKRQPFHMKRRQENSMKNGTK